MRQRRDPLAHVFQLALKSGTVTPSGGFTAHPDGFKAELTDKPLPHRTKSVD